MRADAEEPQLPHWSLTEQILGCFFTAFRELGHGFSESVLKRALAIVLRQAGMEVWLEAPVDVHFRGICLGRFRADLIVNRTVLLEVKATVEIEPYVIAQTLNYLKAAGGGVGLVLCFGKKPIHRRLVVGNPMNSLPLLQSSPRATDSLPTGTP
jgi:GxxExxY protein